MRRYVNDNTVPKSVSVGRVLMHNHVRHSLDMPSGLNGFRAWTDVKPASGAASADGRACRITAAAPITAASRYGNYFAQYDSPPSGILTDYPVGEEA